MHVAIVGKGPSLARLQFNRPLPDVTIALNQAILAVREHRLTHVYSMQKDGCEPHSGIDYPGNRQPMHDCPPGDMVMTREGERLILSQYESSTCLASAPGPRTIIAPEPWYMTSVEAAARFAVRELGASRIDLYCFDGYTRGDIATWQHESEPMNQPLSQGYITSAARVAQYLAEQGVVMQWVTP